MLALPLASASAEENCGSILNDQGRLDCYDRQFRSAPAPAPARAEEPAAPPSEPSDGASESAAASAAEAVAPASTAQPATQPAPEPEPELVQEPAATPPAAAPDTASTLGEEDVKQAEPPPPPEPRPDAVQAHIAEIEVMAFGKRRFILDNGQAWQQNEADRKRFAIGTGVTIKRAGLSGYRLIADNGVSTRVSRIR